MAGIMCQLLPEHYQHYSKTSIAISMSSDSFGKFFVTAEYSVATHNKTFCPLPNCKYHNLLRSTNYEKLLKNLDFYHFVYQLVDCFSTLYKYQFFWNVFIVTGGVFDMVAKAVAHDKQNKSVEKTPSIAKKTVDAQVVEKALLSWTKICKYPDSWFISPRPNTKNPQFKVWDWLSEDCGLFSGWIRKYGQ